MTIYLAFAHAGERLQAGSAVLQYAFFQAGGHERVVAGRGVMAALRRGIFPHGVPAEDREVISVGNAGVGGGATSPPRGINPPVLKIVNFFCA